MKFYIIAAALALSLSSCLKESIPDAMLAAKNKSMQESAASFSYEVNGNAVHLTVTDADNWIAYGQYYTLACSKYSGYYGLEAVTPVGEFTFDFYGDSLAIQNYKYTGGFGELFITDYNNQAEFLKAPSDSMSFNLTSYSNGRISGNFSGVLTPLITGSTINNIYGTPSSVSITNGSFKNVPVIY